MRAMVLMTPDTLSGLRDRALLLLGFAGAFRRSELVALNVADIAECEGGLRVRVRRSKTDQEGQGRTCGDWIGAVRPFRYRLCVALACRGGTVSVALLVLSST
jgi:site-specific recombinase XerD